ncbi:GAF domain-containing protein [Anaerolineales bacterium HSG25]|nr:GAF domain-containing protein [Anaerolineales bacterium HSG25]
MINQTQSTEQTVTYQQQLEQENAQLRATLEKTNQITKTIQVAALALTQSLDLDTILNTLLEYLVQLVPYDSACIMLLNNENVLTVPAVRSHEKWTDSQALDQVTFSYTELTNLNYIFEHKTSLIISSTKTDPSWVTVKGLEYILSWVGVPLIVGDEILGLFSLDKAEENFFTPTHVQLIETLAAYAAVAIENAHLYTETEHSLKNYQQMEAVSNKRARKYYDLVENAQSIILEWDTKGNVIFMNQYGLTFFGYTADELIGQNIMDTIVPKTESTESAGEGRDLSALMNDILKNPEAYINNENENVTKTGERVWAVWSNTAQFDEEGELTGILSIANDITIKKQTEASLYRQNAYLAALHETTLGLMGRRDLKELLETVIIRAGQLLGTSHGSIYLGEPGTNQIHLEVGVGIFRPMVGVVLQSGESMPGKVWQTGQPLFVTDYSEWKGISTDFDYSQLRAGIGVPLRSGSEIVGVIGIGYSYHNQKSPDGEAIQLLNQFAQLASVGLDNARLYNDMQQAREDAELANQTKSSFLANVSHELRTPLTSVLGFAKIIQKRLDLIFPHVQNNERRLRRAMQQVSQNVGIIIAEGERLTALINDVLDLAKIEAGKIEWHMEPLDMSNIIERALMATASLFENRDVLLVREFSPNLPQVIGDQDRLIQVMINLISNAVKFTDIGVITCRLEQNEGEIRVSVTDTGAGISEEDQPKIFDKFRQVGDTLTDKPKGTGLGLPICKEIILNHEGMIWVESELGKGTSFIFTLPILSPAQSPIAEAWIKKLDIDTLLQQFEAHRTLNAEQPDSQKKAILVVDDETHIRELLKQELVTKGYDVLEATDGLEAISQVKKQHPDLIILDVMMPKMNGFNVAELLKNNPLTANIPIILLTIVEDKAKGFRLGVDRYFSKPIDTPKLFKEIDVLLSQGGSRKKVLIVDKEIESAQTLANVLQEQGFTVNITSDKKDVFLPKAITFQPDMIILNSLQLAQHKEVVKALRFEKGLENVMIFFFQDPHINQPK